MVYIVSLRIIGMYSGSGRKDRSERGGRKTGRLFSFLKKGDDVCIRTVFHILFIFLL